MSSPLQRALLQSAAAVAPRGLWADVQHVFDHYRLSPFSCPFVLLRGSYLRASAQPMLDQRALDAFPADLDVELALRHDDAHGRSAFE